MSQPHVLNYQSARIENWSTRAVTSWEAFGSSLFTLFLAFWSAIVALVIIEADPLTSHTLHFRQYAVIFVVITYLFVNSSWVILYLIATIKLRKPNEYWAEIGGSITGMKLAALSFVITVTFTTITNTVPVSRNYFAICLSVPLLWWLGRAFIRAITQSHYNPSR